MHHSSTNLIQLELYTMFAKDTKCQDYILHQNGFTIELRHVTFWIQLQMQLTWCFSFYLHVCLAAVCIGQKI